jgi:hypothetical protein
MTIPMTIPMTIKEEQLAQLRALRDDIARRNNYDRTERLRKQREAEVISDYWGGYAAKVSRRTGRGAR